MAWVSDHLALIAAGVVLAIVAGVVLYIVYLHRQLAAAKSAAVASEASRVDAANVEAQATLADIDKARAETKAKLAAVSADVTNTETADKGKTDADVDRDLRDRGVE